MWRMARRDLRFKYIDILAKAFNSLEAFVKNVMLKCQVSVNGDTKHVDVILWCECLKPIPYDTMALIKILWSGTSKTVTHEFFYNICIYYIYGVIHV